MQIRGNIVLRSPPVFFTLEINRPSLLLLKAEARNDGIDIRVGGKVVVIARGEFL